MRLIKTFNDERSGMAFFSFLDSKGIKCQFDIQTDNDWGSSDYGVYKFNLWIDEEDQVGNALKWLHLFEINPNDPVFNLASQPIHPHPKSSSEMESLPPNIPASSSSIEPPGQVRSTGWEKLPMGPITRILLLTCTLLLLLTQLMMPSLNVPERYKGLSLFTSPVEKTLLYDYPKFYELIDQFIKTYGYEGLENPKELAPEGQRLLQQINQTPYWQGIYSLLTKDSKNNSEKNLTDPPRFEKIKEGQVWRLFTPCLLHGDIFHLFFNMLWLLVLGKQIEARLGTWRYIFFILVIGILSNTAQYLTSGPNFLGFSGVLCGMLAFIWVRQQRAAWEGYQVDRLTLIFMLIFILGMAFVQIFSFFIEKSLDLSLSPNIANMAHLIGGLAGYVLGRTNLFSWRHS